MFQMTIAIVLILDRYLLIQPVVKRELRLKLM